MEWQVVAGLDDCEDFSERPNSKPNHFVEAVEILPDGVEFKSARSLPLNL